MNKKEHWDYIYENKLLTEVSWFQPTPETSLKLINDSGLAKSDRIIDIGGGDSFLVDHLLDLGYSNLTVLDISEKAILRAKKRLGPRAELVHWIVADISQYHFSESYDLWHDRAAFHFLNSHEEVNRYVASAERHITAGGHLIIGTFSENGPKKCSGIDIQQYSVQNLNDCFIGEFSMVESLIVQHTTPFDTIQEFTFSRFKKK